MAETLHFDGDNRRNDDALTPADWRRLKFLSHSPSPYHASLLCSAKDETRSQVMMSFEVVDSVQNDPPGSGHYYHHRWVRSLAFFDPQTYEFEESAESLRVREELALYIQLEQEYLEELRSAGETDLSFWRMQPEVWRRLQAKLGRPEEGGESGVVEIGSRTHRATRQTFAPSQAQERHDQAHATPAPNSPPQDGGVVVPFKRLERRNPGSPGAA